MSALLPIYERDLVLASGRGARLFDSAGRGYLDFAAGIGVNGLGYGDRAVVAAIRKQAARLIHASNLYHTEPAAALAERLVSLAFPAKVFLCNSGTEAGESALKFARRLGKPNGRSELVAFERSFHGRTLGTLSITWNAKYREPFEPLIPGVRFCPWDDLEAASAAVGPGDGGGRGGTGPGRGRRAAGAAGVPARPRVALPRARRAPHRRRGAVWPGTHGTAVRLPACGDHPGHLDAGQAAGRRPAAGARCC
jgi:hypothetical protein